VAGEIWLAEGAIKIEAAAPGLRDASLATMGLFRRCLSGAGKFRERRPKRAVETGAAIFAEMEPEAKAQT
jgi:hypothetical protein